MSVSRCELFWPLQSFQRFDVMFFCLVYFSLQAQHGTGFLWGKEELDRISGPGRSKQGFPVLPGTSCGLWPLLWARDGLPHSSLSMTGPLPSQPVTVLHDMATPCGDSKVTDAG